MNCNEEFFRKRSAVSRIEEAATSKIIVTLFVVVAVCMLGLYFNLAAVTNCCFAIVLPRTLSNPFQYFVAVFHKFINPACRAGLQETFFFTSRSVHSSLEM